MADIANNSYNTENELLALGMSSVNFIALVENLLQRMYVIVACKLGRWVEMNRNSLFTQFNRS